MTLNHRARGPIRRARSLITMVAMTCFALVSPTLRAAEPCAVACLPDDAATGRCRLGARPESGGACLGPGVIQESCNGMDDDCDGSIDEGADICREGFTCDRGSCKPICDEDLFACRGSWVCSERGVCVEPSCQTVRCDPGAVCVEGACLPGCRDVVCPDGQRCIAGACVDPCASLDCPEACVDGVCQPASCVLDSCGGCPAGQRCDDGSCRNACQGVRCPHRQVCIQGRCEDDPTPPNEAGGSGGSAGTGLIVEPIGDDSGTGGSAGSRDRVDIGPGNDADATGCSLAQPGSPPLPWLSLAIALGLLGRRRRPRRHPGQALPFFPSS